MAQMFLLDVEELIDAIEARTFKILEESKDMEKIPDILKGKIEGLVEASEAIADFLSQNLNFAKFPEEKNDKVQK